MNENSIFNAKQFIVDVQLSQGDGGTIQTVQSVDTSQDNMTVDLTEATLGQDGQIIITGEDGHGMLRIDFDFILLKIGRFRMIF